MRTAFNTAHVHHRVTVEHVIGRIKSLWPALGLETWNRERGLQSLAFHVGALLTQRITRIRGIFYVAIRDGYFF